MSRWATLLGPVLAGALALTACAGPAAPGDATDPAARDPTVAAAGKADLGFAVATLAGGTFDGQSLAGKPALLWFWAPWCPTCVVEAPQVGQAAHDYQGRITVVGVAGLDTTEAMREFVALPQVGHIVHLADEQGVVWKRFGVTAQSTYVLLDASGHVVYRGYLDGDELTRKLTAQAG
jgi:thiol-disulfide isomerase/thioredoxin